MRFETRDPFQEKQRREDMFSCDWDRFAHIEYHRLAAEEDDGYDSSMEVEMSEEGKLGEGGLHNFAGDADWLIDDDDDDDDLAMGRAGMDSKRGGKGSAKGAR